MLKISYTSSRWTADVLKLMTPFQSFRRLCSVDRKSFLAYEKDPGPVFMQQDVQKLLHSISRLELDKVFRKRSVKNNTVEFKFMTDEQLRGEIVQSIGRARRLLQMPPVVGVIQDSPRVLSKDGALKGFSETKVVITDITYGVKNSKRSIVERLTDGTLQEAAYETRKRLNQIYFPLKGRKVRLPKMFEQGQLRKILENGEYEFVLDRACIQFEPFEQEYHDVTTMVYQHVAENKAFDALRSTRHFGPFAFFLAWHRMIDDLLLDMIKRDYLRNGVELIALYCSLNETSLAAEGFEELKRQLLETDAPVLDMEEKTLDQLQQDEKYLSLIEQFVAEQSIKKVQLNLAIAAYREMASERESLAKGIRKMHGNS